MKKCLYMLASTLIAGGLIAAIVSYYHQDEDDEDPTLSDKSSDENYSESQKYGGGVQKDKELRKENRLLKSKVAGLESKLKRAQENSQKNGVKDFLKAMGVSVEQMRGSQENIQKKYQKQIAEFKERLKLMPHQTESLENFADEHIRAMADLFADLERGEVTFDELMILDQGNWVSSAGYRSIEEALGSVLTPEQAAADLEYKKKHIPGQADVSAHSEVARLQQSIPSITEEQREKIHAFYYKKEIEEREQALVSGKERIHSWSSKASYEEVEKEYQKIIENLRQILHPEQLQVIERQQQERLEQLKLRRQ